MQCKILKLVNGETIMGSIVEEGKTYVDVYRPLKIAISMRGEATMNVVLIKWDPTMDFSTPSRIFKSGILSVNEPNKDFLDSYVEVFNEYDNKENNTKEIETVDDLAEELEKLVEMMSSSNTHTFH